jgi:pimeloyl-ACP methyl ester carboxylesterase
MPKTPAVRVIVGVVLGAAAIYSALVIFVFTSQRKLIYHPAQGSMEQMEKDAEAHGLKPWKTDRGDFMGWERLGKSRRKHDRLLIVHGNAGCAVDRADYANALSNAEPMDVYILEYPGYGARSGEPSEQSIFAAASEGLESIKDKGPLYIMGESLGTGVAAYLAATYPDTVRGLLLIAPYDNLTDVGRAQMPWLPVGLLLQDKFPSEDYLKKYHGPVAMLFAGHDTVVPNRLGHKLYDGYAGPKHFWQVDGAGHNDLLDEPPEFWTNLATFWRTNVPMDAPAADPAQ